MVTQIRIKNVSVLTAGTLFHFVAYQSFYDVLFTRKKDENKTVKNDIGEYIKKGQEPTDTSKQPIRTSYLALGHVTSY